MRDSVLLNSWDSFLVTLPSTSSETCVIYSSLILGTDVLRDWPFLGCSSCVSLVTAASFRLFLNVVIFLKGKCYAVMKTELLITITDNQSDIKYLSLPYFHFSYLYTFNGGEHNCLHAKSRYKVGKRTLTIIITKEKCQLWREINTFPSISSLQTASLPSFDGKYTGVIHRKWTSKCLFPRRHKI